MPYYTTSVTLATATWGFTPIQLPKNSRIKLISLIPSSYAMVFYSAVMIGKFTAAPTIAPIIYDYIFAYLVNFPSIHNTTKNLDALIVDGQITLRLYHTAGANRDFQITIYYEVEK